VFIKDRTREAKKEGREEGKEEMQIEMARRMIQKGKMTLDEISDYVPGLSMEELEQIEAEVMNLA
jgi:flagellar biosynthesis/type III secretory pathway protein FliH